jgi:VanZ family protein
MFDRLFIGAGNPSPPLLTRRRFLFAATAFFLLMIAAGAVPGKAEAASALVGDKLLHVVAYTLLTALVFGALRGRPISRGMRTVLIVAVLGAVDESIQALLPYRHANWADWKFDLMAAAACVSLLIVFLQGRSVPASSFRTMQTDPRKPRKQGHISN